tara:strand:+ start:64061 stop:64747 length:687 start_codon:yes stop_codon:yes gene_type:complete
MSENRNNQHPEESLPAGALPRELNLNWTIAGVMSEAWHLKNDFKGTYCGATLIFMVASILLGGAGGFIAHDSEMMNIIMQLIIIFVTYPLMAGVIMIAIKRSVGTLTTVSMVFDYYPKTIPIFLTYLLMMVMIAIGLILLVLPGIYLLIAYTLTLPLVVDRNLGPWEALEASRKALTPCWFRYFGLSLICSVLVAISAIPLGIGLIWTLPFMGLAMAIVYRDVVGVSQ